MNHDKLCRKIVTNNPNMLVPWYLMACYAYDKRGASLISDHCFDWLYPELEKKWDSVEHMHKIYIDYLGPGSLKSAIAVIGYTLMMEHATINLLDKLNVAYLEERMI